MALSHHKVEIQKRKKNRNNNLESFTFSHWKSSKRESHKAFRVNFLSKKTHNNHFYIPNYYYLLCWMRNACICFTFSSFFISLFSMTLMLLKGNGKIPNPFFIHLFAMPGDVVTIRWHLVPFSLCCCCCWCCCHFRPTSLFTVCKARFFPLRFLYLQFFIRCAQMTTKEFHRLIFYLFFPRWRCYTH